jgi:hypothetical protein
VHHRSGAFLVTLLIASFGFVGCSGLVAGNNGNPSPTTLTITNVLVGSTTTFSCQVYWTTNVPGPQGIYLDTQASNACVNNNTFTAGSGLATAISANSSGDLDLGNIFNLLSSNLPLGVCAPPLPYINISPIIRLARRHEENRLEFNRYRREA